MQIKYKVFAITNTTVLAPPSSYYARQGDSDQEELITLNFVDEFDNEEDAIAVVENSIKHTQLNNVNRMKREKINVEYTILKTYKS